MAPSDSSVNLKSQVENLRRENVQGEFYIPLLQLHEVLTPESVHAELKTANDDSLRFRPDEITTKVLEGAKVIFAILVVIKKVESVKHLIERNQLHDRLLPFERWDEGLGWDLSTFYPFYEAQWEFLAPQFTRGTIVKRFGSKIVLPFQKNEMIDRGGFGTVYEISLDPDHQNLEMISQERVVRKELTSEATDPTELESLAMLNRLSHPNITRLLDCYFYKGKYNLVFLLAKGGDFKSQLAKRREDTAFREDESLIFALAELSSALEQVHNFFDEKLDLRRIGCHHDFKPRNILVYGTNLLLADFGISRFTSISEGSKAPFEPVMDDYSAPECEILEKYGSIITFKKSRIGRSSDIWSYGCVLAEVLVYMAFGPEDVKQFYNDRVFQVGEQWSFHYFHRFSSENPAVQDWLSKVATKLPRTKAFLIPLIQRMLSMQEEHRPGAAEVTTCLRRATIFEAAHSVCKLFETCCQIKDSLDVSLQLWRFEAWEQAIGITGEAVAQVETTSFHGTDEFRSTMKCINDIRHCLKSISSAANDPMPQLRAVGDHIDWLNAHLSGPQRIRAKNRLSSLVIESRFSEFVENRKNDPALDKIGLDREIRMLVALKSMNELTKTHACQNPRGQQIRYQQVDISKSFGSHHLGWHIETETENKIPILIEWRTYGRTGADHQVTRKLFARMESIVNLLKTEKPGEFRSLSCRGFFHDPSLRRFGVTYDLPLDPVENFKDGPVTLQRLISDNRGISKQPNLEDKFYLASTLSNALLGFHIVGWLHKDIASSNIIFCDRGTALQSNVIREPYIVGFNHSRPNEESVFTEGPPKSDNDDYQHPNYQHDVKRFRQEYDYYSLGLVLLEIGFWNTIEKWKKEWTETSKRTIATRELHHKLLESRVPFLAQIMGSNYKNAVVACLTGEFAIGDSGEHAHGDDVRRKMLRLGFENLVVERLGRRLT